MTGSPDGGAAFPRGRNRGTLVVGGCLVIGLGLAAFAICFQWGQTRRCLAYYGGPAAAAMQSAARVELWDLDPASGADSPTVTARHDVSLAPGLVHLRRGLVEDANFAWERSVTRSHGWQAALAFFAATDAAEPTVILFLDLDPEAGAVWLAGRPAPIATGRLGRGLRTWVQAARQPRYTPGF